MARSMPVVKLEQALDSVPSAHVNGSDAAMSPGLHSLNGLHLSTVKLCHMSLPISCPETRHDVSDASDLMKVWARRAVREC